MTDKSPTRIVIAKPPAKSVQKAVAASVPTVRCDAASLVRFIRLTSQSEPVASASVNLPGSPAMSGRWDPSDQTDQVVASCACVELCRLFHSVGV